jgi:hypothetical protein
VRVVVEIVVRVQAGLFRQSEPSNTSGELDQTEHHVGKVIRYDGRDQCQQNHRRDGALSSRSDRERSRSPLAVLITER